MPSALANKALCKVSSSCNSFFLVIASVIANGFNEHLLLCDWVHH